MMDNPYTCSTELDELSADETIIDYSVFADDSFILIALLTSNGEAQAYLETGRDRPRKNVVDVRKVCSTTASPTTICIGTQAAFVLFGLSDGSMLVMPIKLFIDVTWGGSSWSTTSVIDLSLPTVEQCLATPTCIKCFTSNFPPRTMAVCANKAGYIFLIDLQLRKSVVELRAPQSVHQIEVLMDENSIELLITGFTGAQWIIPIERNGRGFREVLTTCIPADLQLLEPSKSQYTASDVCGVVALDTAGSVVEIYSTFHSLAKSSKKSFLVPTETWLVHSTENVLFTVSSENELRSAVHFGFTAVRLEYSLVRDSTKWRPLGFVSMPRRQNKLAGVFLVNERGLVRIEQSDSYALEKIAAEFVIRLTNAQLNIQSISQVADACRIDITYLQRNLIRNLLSSRHNRPLRPKELRQILAIAKVSRKTMPDLLKTFEEEGMSEQLLPEVLKTVQTNPTQGMELKEKVVKLFVRKAEKNSGEARELREYDAELSMFIAKHESVCDGAFDCCRVGLWKCALTLALRHIHNTQSTDICVDLLVYVVKEGQRVWRSSHSNDRMQIMSLVCHLDWSQLSDSDASKLCALLSAWQRDVAVHSIHEMCLRTALAYISKFPRACQILCLVSSIHLIAEKKISDSVSSPSWLPLAAGYNSGAVIGDDDRILVWGDFHNQQQRSFDTSQMKPKRSASTEAPSTPSTSSPTHKTNLPRALEFSEGRPRAVAIGAEHILVLSSSGHISAWGGNAYGQCGVGHCFRLTTFQQLSGDWPLVVSISCGQFHSALLCDDGSLWMFGWGFYGQLGQGGRKNADVHTPTKVNGLVGKVTAVACGRVHTVVLTDKGRVLVCGGGSYGQMGLDDDIKKTFAFTPLDVDGSIVTQIATSFYMSICVTEDDRIFEWGRNPQELKMRMFVMKKLRSAQMKNEETNDETGTPQRQNLNLPAEIPREDMGLREVKHLLDGKIATISCGLSHSALVTTQGTLYTWGKSLDFQLGHGNKAERCEPHQLFEPNNTKFALVACGNNHTLASTDDGLIYGWGRNDFAQCGTVSKKTAVNDSPKKFYFQAKDGRRFLPTIDDSQFVQTPTLIPDACIRVAASSCDAAVDEDELVDRLQAAELPVVQAVSRHLYAQAESQPETEPVKCVEYDGEDGPLCTTTALVHLMAGDVERAIRLIEWLKSDRSTPSESLTALSSLVWEVVANHEDVQTQSTLTSAFRHVPMSDSMRRGKQIAQLWPTVWNDEAAQSSLSIDEKIAMLDGFVPAQPENCVTVPSSSLDVASRLRVFAQCAHVEPAMVGTPPECSACAEEWVEKVRATLGAAL